MAENVKALRRRLRSIKNTKQITRAMEMVSAAKLRRAQELLMAGRPYAAKLQELLGRLASGAAIDHPLFQQREVNNRILVILTADRGLAGSFNAQVIKRAEKYLRENGSDNVQLVLIGKKGYDYFKTKKYRIAWSVTDLAGKLSGTRSNEIAERLLEMFLAGEADEIFVLYNSFVSMMVYRATMEKLLPLDPESLLANAQQSLVGKANVEYILEPEPAELFASLLPRFVRSKIYISLAETLTAEHSARMISMSAATKNCQELIDSVSLAMNKARQAAITKEILEIVGGAEALKG